MDSRSWIANKLETPEFQFFTYIDSDYIKDRFNLTGIETGEWRLLDLVEFILSPDSYSSAEDEMQMGNGDKEGAAKRFYGLVHARYITTTRGQQKMLQKFVNADFGRCPRALCRAQPVLPLGLHDLPDHSYVKLYCPKCEDIYHPPAQHNASLDGAYFGTSFPGMLFQSYPKHLPRRTSEQFCLKMFGFKIHNQASLVRWQQRRREEMEKELRQAGVGV